METYLFVFVNNSSSYFTQLHVIFKCVFNPSHYIHIIKESSMLREKKHFIQLGDKYYCIAENISAGFCEWGGGECNYFIIMWLIIFITYMILLFAVQYFTLFHTVVKYSLYLKLLFLQPYLFKQFYNMSSDTYFSLIVI